MALKQEGHVFSCLVPLKKTLISKVQMFSVTDMYRSLRCMDDNLEDSLSAQAGGGGDDIGSLRIIPDCQQRLHLTVPQVFIKPTARVITFP